MTLSPETGTGCKRDKNAAPGSGDRCSEGRLRLPRAAAAGPAGAALCCGAAGP